MKSNPLPRIDLSPEVREQLLPFCRLAAGEIWDDPEGLHRVACIDAADGAAVSELMAGKLATLAIQDPPYNLVAFQQTDDIGAYIRW